MSSDPIVSVSELKTLIDALILEANAIDSASLETEIADTKTKLAELEIKLAKLNQGVKRKDSWNHLKQYLETDLKDDTKIRCKSKTHRGCNRETLEEMADMNEEFETAYYPGDPNEEEFEKINNGFYVPAPGTKWFT